MYAYCLTCNREAPNPATSQCPDCGDNLRVFSHRPARFDPERFRARRRGGSRDAFYHWWRGVAVFVLLIMASARGIAGLVDLGDMLRIEEARQVGTDWIQAPPPPISGVAEQIQKVGGALVPLLMAISLARALGGRRGAAWMAAACAAAWLVYLGWLLRVPEEHLYLGRLKQTRGVVAFQGVSGVLAAVAAWSYARRGPYQEGAHGPARLLAWMRRVRVDGPYRPVGATALVLSAVAAIAQGAALLHDASAIARTQDLYFSEERQRGREDLKFGRLRDPFSPVALPCRVLHGIAALSFGVACVMLARGRSTWGISWVAALGTAWVLLGVASPLDPDGAAGASLLAARLPRGWAPAVAALAAIVALALRPGPGHARAIRDPSREG